MRKWKLGKLRAESIRIYVIRPFVKFVFKALSK